MNARDDDDFIDSPTEPLPRPTHPIPNSPPPSFRSRASSRERNQLVNPDLADAFDDDSDESDDEGDDRQRLVRGTGGATSNDAASSLSSQTQGTTTRTTSTPATATGSAPTSGRVYGGGIQSDGVFSNLTAKPELGGEEKEELPPVCFLQDNHRIWVIANSLAVIRRGCRRPLAPILGDDALGSGPWDARRRLH